MSNVNLFGFGSFFRREAKFNDIDILIVHEDLTNRSCFHAINCKKKLESKLPLIRATILSRSEEKDLNFIKRSNGVKIGEISEYSSDTNLDEIITLIEQILKKKLMS